MVACPQSREDWVLEIAGRLRDGQATSDEIRELESELTANASSLQRYLSFVALDAQLGLTGQILAADLRCASADLPQSSTEIATLSSVPVRNTSRRSRFRSPFLLFIGLGCTAIAVAVTCLWAASHPQVYLVRGVGHQFIGPGPDSPRQNLVGREFELQEGFVQLHFRAAEADVVVEAPARFCAVDSKTLRVHRGRITAHVRDGKKGLRVLTSEMDVLDLGTRFAIDAAPDRRSEVHVFEGKVEAGVASSGNRQLLEANNALRFAVGSNATDCDLRKGSFVQPEELPQLANGLRGGQRERARKAYLGLKADETLLLASDFDAPAHNGSVKVYGAKPVQGRFPGSKAYDFVETADCASLHGELQARRFTIMTWVRLNNELSQSPDNSLFHTDGWSRMGQIHWMISCGGGHNGRMRFAIHTGLTDQKERTLWAVSDKSLLETLTRWTHLAITYDADRSQVTFFVNGAVDKTVTLPSAFPAVLGPAEIGNWSPNGANGEFTRRRLRGRMDEFMILSRPLTEPQVNDYFRQTTPYR